MDPDRNGADQLRERFAQIMLRKLAQEQYPGESTMRALDRLPGKARIAYASLLLTKIENDAFPSPDMVSRVMSLLSSA
jgi:hypothetical protein